MLKPSSNSTCSAHASSKFTLWAVGRVPSTPGPAAKPCQPYMKLRNHNISCESVCSCSHVMCNKTWFRCHDVVHKGQTCPPRNRLCHASHGNIHSTQQVLQLSCTLPLNAAYTHATKTHVSAHKLP